MTNQSRALRVLIVAAVALAAVGALAGGAAAATDTLAGDGTDEVTDFNASSADHIEYSLSADDGTNGFSGDGSDVLYLNVTDANGEEHTLEEVDISETDGVTGSDTSYTFNISQSELATLGGDANDTSTTTVYAWGEDSSTDTVNTTTDSFAADFTFTENYAVVYAGDAAANGDINGLSADTETEEKWFGFGDNSSTHSVEADGVGLGQNASGTTIHVVAANTSGEDPFSEATEGGILSSIETKDFVGAHQLLIESHPHAVFNEEAPGDLASGYTYATVGERNGHDAYSIHVDDDYEGESTLDVETRANDEYRFDKKLGVKADAFGGYLSGLTAMTSPSASTVSFAA